jgi:hypothetical protein
MSCRTPVREAPGLRQNEPVPRGPQAGAGLREESRGRSSGRSWCPGQATARRQPCHRDCADPAGVTRLTESGVRRRESGSSRRRRSESSGWFPPPAGRSHPRRRVVPQPLAPGAMEHVLDGDHLTGSAVEGHPEVAWLKTENRLPAGVEHDDIDRGRLRGRGNSDLRRRRLVWSGWG